MCFASQISNRNFLSPGGFRFVLAKFPKVAYFAQSANVPSLELGLVGQPTPMRTINLDGMMTFGQFTLTFIVDEDMENFLILQNWMRGLGTPDSLGERSDYLKNQADKYSQGNLGEDRFADGTLSILNSNLQPKFNVNFTDLKPVSLTTLDFDATLSDQEYFQAIVVFDYTSYEIQTLDGKQIKKLA